MLPLYKPLAQTLTLAARLLALAPLLTLALGVWAPPVQAQSTPWDRLSHAIRAKNTARDEAVAISARNSEAQADGTKAPAPTTVGAPVSGVPNEVSAPTPLIIEAPTPAPVMASLNAESSLTTTSMLNGVNGGTGLAVDGAKNRNDVKIDLGRESDETDAVLASNLFKNNDILRLLGEKPRFVYNPADRPDPMLVPWVRRAAIFRELSVRVETYMKNREFAQAVPLLKQIVAMNDPRFTPLAQGKLTEIAAQEEKLAAVANGDAAQNEVKVELPGWVNDNTTGVIVTPGNEVCLVGDYMLHVGEKLPNYPDIAVASINEKKVVYQIQDKTFEVTLNTEELVSTNAKKSVPAATSMTAPVKRK